MRVMCIDGEWTGAGPDIAFGEICTVIDSYFDPQLKLPAYEFSEYPDYGYEQSGFIPLSDIDEIELVKERELSITFAHVEGNKNDMFWYWY